MWSSLISELTPKPFMCSILMLSASLMLLMVTNPMISYLWELIKRLSLASKYSPNMELIRPKLSSLCLSAIKPLKTKTSKMSSPGTSFPSASWEKSLSQGVPFIFLTFNPFTIGSFTKENSSFLSKPPLTQTIIDSLLEKYMFMISTLAKKNY